MGSRRPADMRGRRRQRHLARGVLGAARTERLLQVCVAVCMLLRRCVKSALGDVGSRNHRRYFMLAARRLAAAAARNPLVRARRRLRWRHRRAHATSIDEDKYHRLASCTLEGLQEVYEDLADDEPDLAMEVEYAVSSSLWPASVARLPALYPAFTSCHVHLCPTIRRTAS